MFISVSRGTFLRFGSPPAVLPAVPKKFTVYLWYSYTECVIIVAITSIELLPLFQGVFFERRKPFMGKLLKKLSPPRVIALCFALTILLGSVLLIMPFSVRDGVELRYIDSLFTATSAVCVTGLVTVDTYDTFTAVGQSIIAVMIQIGGLGVATIGAGVILAMGKRMDLRGRKIVRESINFGSGKGVVRLVRSIFATTAVIELAGAVLNFCVFIRRMPFLRAVGVSLFHSVASFNNAGFDIFGNMQSMTAYKDDVMLNLVTCALVILGGVGFLVVRDLLDKRFRWKRLSLHSKVVLSFSGILLAGGTLLFKLTENFSWLGAFFNSVSARTAGFSTYPLGGFTNAGLIVMLVLMFIGASPGSTGGGVKTSTIFVLVTGIRSAATNRSEKAFRYSVPRNAFKKAAVVTLIALGVIVTGTFLFCLAEPDIPFRDSLFEVTSAFGTVGLSTGITPTLGTAAKIILIPIMYIGRLGPLTVATLWYFSRGERVRYPEGNIAIG